MNMDREEIQLQHRMQDLAEKCFQCNQYTCTGFLSLAQQELFWQIQRELSYVPYELYGGNEACERKILRFGDATQLGYWEPFPIACVHILPAGKKYAEDLSHRDYLGALMNLGMERSTLGDIFWENGEAWLFCKDTMADYICENLTQVRHTAVHCQVVDAAESLPIRKPESIEVTVSSERMDGVIAGIYHLSRQKSQDLFGDKKIYVDGRGVESPGRILKPGELVTVRGFGRFLYEGKKCDTRKGKLCVKAQVYR